MTTTVWASGRFCNHLIRNLAVSIIAEKHDLAVDYSYRENANALGIQLFSGTRRHGTMVQLTEDNYFQVLESDHITYDLDPNWRFFQRGDIVRHIRSYLTSQLVKESVMTKNPFSDRYAVNNDAFIHARLTDTKESNPGLEYYLKALSMVTFNTLYIATDDFNDDIIKGLVNAYPTAEMVHKSDVETIQFGSTCKHVILSHGTFSAMIGLLSYYSDVLYPPHREGRIWYDPTTFDIPDWRVVELI
jgi:hypothetical protein